MDDDQGPFQVENAYDIFISYSREDGADFARKLGDALRKTGYRVWFDDQVLRLGDDFKGIETAIQESGLFVAIITPKFCDEERFAFKEFLMAISEQEKRAAAGNRRAFILPILHNISGSNDPKLKQFNTVAQALQGQLYKFSTDELSGLINDIKESTGVREDVVVDTEAATLKIGRFPVTNLEYRRFINDGGYRTEGLRSWWSDMGKDFWMAYAKREDHDFLRTIRTEDQIISANMTVSDSNYNLFNQPVTGVCYFEAEAYCNWLEEKSGVSTRLPTELEWLAVMRSGGRRFPWGDSDPTPELANLIPERTEKDAPLSLEALWQINTPSFMGKHPKGATQSGCHDLIGNVWEWVHDFVPDDELRKEEDPNNKAKILGNCSFDPPSRVNDTPRSFRYPGYRHYVIGFRIAQLISE